MPLRSAISPLIRRREKEVAAITGGPLAVPITVEDGDVRVGFPYT